MEGGVEKPGASGVQPEALQKAEISLNDCLACRWVHGPCELLYFVADLSLVA